VFTTDDRELNIDIRKLMSIKTLRVTLIRLTWAYVGTRGRRWLLTAPGWKIFCIDKMSS